MPLKNVTTWWFAQPVTHSSLRAAGMASRLPLILLRDKLFFKNLITKTQITIKKQNRAEEICIIAVQLPGNTGWNFIFAFSADL